MADTHHILKSHMAAVYGALGRLVDDVTEQESMKTFNNNPNHIKWLTGHLVTTSALSGKLLGGKLEVPDGWGKLFGRGNEVNSNPDAYPPMDAVRERLFDYHRMVQEFVDLQSEADLNAEIEVMPNWKESRIGAVLFFLSHDFYHGGQISMIRRALGRERSFG